MVDLDEEWKILSESLVGQLDQKIQKLLTAPEEYFQHPFPAHTLETMFLEFLEFRSQLIAPHRKPSWIRLAYREQVQKKHSSSGPLYLKFESASNLAPMLLILREFYEFSLSCM